MSDLPPLRHLPSVDALAATLDFDGLSPPERVSVAREAVAEARSRLMAGESADPFEIAHRLATTLRLRAPVPILNATGVILHTNLGRAPLSRRALEAARSAAATYTNTELDRSDGERGSRGAHTRRLLRELTGAEAALVVNNNAAAVLLTLAALSHGRAVPVSRGELIEIGGSYRLPDVMRASGARLVEVGTTNRTRIGDYVTALQVHDCGLLLKIHPSNYEVTGFVAGVGVAELVETSTVPVAFDIGSGLLDEATPWLERRPAWLTGEPGARQALDDGADLVLFSGDKMLGGPQAGVILGRAELVEKIGAHPLARAVRIDTATDAALGATLEAYLGGDASEIPFWEMATLGSEALLPRVESLARAIGGDVEEGRSLIGAGSAPGARLTSPVLRLGGRQDAFLPLLQSSPAVLARRERGDLLVDLRTVPAVDDAILEQAMTRCL